MGCCCRSVPWPRWNATAGAEMQGCAARVVLCDLSTGTCGCLAQSWDDLRTDLAALNEGKLTIYVGMRESSVVTNLGHCLPSRPLRRREISRQGRLLGLCE